MSRVVVRIQMLSELEEIIQYKQMYDLPQRQAMMRQVWMKRLVGCQRNVEVWQRVLKIRALVVSPKEDKDIWIKFANLCRKSGRPNVSLKVLQSIMDDPSDGLNNDPHVTYAYLKYMWSTDQKQEAYDHMKNFVKTLGRPLGFTSDEDLSELAEKSNSQSFRLLARCFLKLGMWNSHLNEQTISENLEDVLEFYHAATVCDKDWYKAWHSWALTNFQAIAAQDRSGSITTSVIDDHVVPAVQGFFRSISLSKGNSLQDTLRLLTLLFQYGSQESVYMTISECFSTVSIDTWLQVIPQLIARIHTPNANVRRLVHQLLTEIGKEHPQSLVYPLTVASKSQSVPRKKSATSLIEKMRIHSNSLIEQALVVSQELIRVAILWHEMWHEGLEEASRLYFGEQDIDGMLSTLEPLHKLIEKVRMA
jgi:FKBP12-rapamycin complex-associated protein